MPLSARPFALPATPEVIMDASSKTSRSLDTFKESHITEAILPEHAGPVRGLTDCPSIAAFEITQHVSQLLILPLAFWWLEGISSCNLCLS